VGRDVIVGLHARRISTGGTSRSQTCGPSVTLGRSRLGRDSSGSSGFARTAGRPTASIACSSRAREQARGVRELLPAVTQPSGTQNRLPGPPAGRPQQGAHWRGDTGRARSLKRVGQGPGAQGQLLVTSWQMSTGLQPTGRSSRATSGKPVGMLRWEPAPTSPPGRIPSSGRRILRTPRPARRVRT